MKVSSPKAFSTFSNENDSKRADNDLIHMNTDRNDILFSPEGIKSKTARNFDQFMSDQQRHLETQRSKMKKIVEELNQTEKAEYTHAPNINNVILMLYHALLAV